MTGNGVQGGLRRNIISPVERTNLRQQTVRTKTTLAAVLFVGTSGGPDLSRRHAGKLGTTGVSNRKQPAWKSWCALEGDDGHSWKKQGEPFRPTRANDSKQRGSAREKSFGQSASFRALSAIYNHTKERAVNDSARVARWLRVALSSATLVARSLTFSFELARSDSKRLGPSLRHFYHLLSWRKSGTTYGAQSAVEVSGENLDSPRLSQMSGLVRYAAWASRFFFKRLDASNLNIKISWKHLVHVAGHRELLGSIRGHLPSENSNLIVHDEALEPASGLISAASRFSMWFRQLQSTTGAFTGLSRKRLSLHVHSSGRKTYADARLFNTYRVLPSTTRGQITAVPVAIALSTLFFLFLGMDAVNAGVVGLSTAALSITISKNTDTTKFLLPSGRRTRETRNSHLVTKSNDTRVLLRYHSHIMDWFHRRRLPLDPTWALSRTRIRRELINQPLQANQRASSIARDTDGGFQLDAADDSRQMDSVVNIPASFARTSTPHVYRIRRFGYLKNHLRTHVRLWRHSVAVPSGRAMKPTGHMYSNGKYEIYAYGSGRKVESAHRLSLNHLDVGVPRSNPTVIDTISRNLPPEQTLLQKFLLCMDRILYNLESRVQRAIRRLRDLGIWPLSTARGNRELLVTIKDRGIEDSFYDK